jgi:hypothetical protein
MGLDIDVHFNRLGPSGATLVVVAVGREVFGATHPEPLAALHTAAREAAEGLAKCGQRIDAAGRDPAGASVDRTNGIRLEREGIVTADDVAAEPAAMAE